MAPSAVRKLTDELFHELVKAERGYTCQISGRKSPHLVGHLSGRVLCLHHVDGKGTLRMRYDRRNVIVITVGLHKFKAHVQTTERAFREEAMNVVGGSEALYKELSDDTTGKLAEYYKTISAEYRDAYKAGRIRLCDWTRKLYNKIKEDN